MPRRLPAFLALSLALLPLAAPGARAATSIPLDGAVLTLAALPPEADGTIRGAIRIELRPGWKTYWIDPGQSGIPASYSFTQGAATLRYPAPHRFGEGIERANGYSGPFAIAFELQGAGPGPVAVSAMLGLCRDICVPASGTVSTAPDEGDRALVEAAFAALPAPAPDGAIPGAALSADGKVLTLALSSASAARPEDVFVSGPEGWYFGEAPAGTATRDGLAFAVPVLGRPRKGPPLGAVDIVLGGTGGGTERRAVPVESAR